MYLDDQKDPRMIDVYPRNRNARDRWNAMIVLRPYLEGSVEEGGVFDCPSAIGASSVRDPETRQGMQSGGIFHVYDIDKYDPYSIPPSQDSAEPEEEFTEYWFNDSYPNVYRDYPSKSLGVSGQLLRALPNLDEVVLAADAVDWIPRHEGKNHFLFGDQRIESIPVVEYTELGDRYNSTVQFYNWGHFYFDKFGPPLN